MRPSSEENPATGRTGSVPVLETERLTLRQWRETDREPFAEMNADPEVMRFFPAVRPRADSCAAVDRFNAHLHRKGWGLWAVEVKQSGDFIGFIGLWPMPEGTPPGTEVGWRLARPHWGKGYAPEGARAALHHAFAVLDLPEVVSMTTWRNTPSRRVMEKIGMTRDPGDDFVHPGVDPQWWGRPHVLYRLTARRWSQLNRNDA